MTESNHKLAYKCKPSWNILNSHYNLLFSQYRWGIAPFTVVYTNFVKTSAGGSIAGAIKLNHGQWDIYN